MLSVKHLQKRFGAHVALADVSFEIRAGETVGVLGPNGAGKTTTLAMISGLAQPDQGSVTFQGQLVHRNANELKLHVGLGQPRIVRRAVWPDRAAACRAAH
jgi:ABC-2 type transport system ATP-binding protein